jgi:hypothetical protein
MPPRHKIVDRDARLIYYAAHPNCERCGRPAVEVHHILGGTACRTDEAWNFLSVCRACHVHIHAKALRQWCVNAKGERWDYERALLVSGKHWRPEL